MKSNRSNKASVNSATATARSLALTLFAVLMTAILVLGLSPITKVSYADAASDASAAQESSASAEDGANSNVEPSANDDAANGSVGSNEEDGDGQASDEKGDSSVTPGKYGNYTYEQNSTKNAFESSAYDAFRDSVATEWLGIAGSFHITGFDEVTTSSHIYGNILTKKLSGNNNFGLDKRYDEAYGYKGLSYIQEYPDPNGNVDGHTDGTFVIGSKNAVTVTDNGNHLAINGVQFNQPNKLVQDTDTASTPFIDLTEVKTYTNKVSDDLAKVADVGAEVKISENGIIKINYEGNSGCAYVTLTAEQLNNMNELHVCGMELNGKCSVVINVDMGDAKQLNLQKVHVYSPDGKDMGTGETDSTVGYVMFNIKNSASDMTVSLSDRVLASVLAPNSTINLGGSAAGTYIGTKVNVTAESHARPFRGTLKPVVGDLSVQKVWKDASGNIEEDVDHDPITAKVLQRSKPKDGEWSDWKDYETVTLSKDNGWYKSWAKLPKKDTDGTTYEYKIVETDESKAANPDYDSVVTNNGIAWVITNTHKHTAEYTEASVAKAWLAADGTAESDDVVSGHGSVQAQLYKKAGDGEFAPEGDPVTLSKENSWSYKWEKLISNDADGITYEYKVEETDESKAANPDYDSTVDHDGTAWVITNTRQEEKESFSLSGYSMRAADAPTPEADKVCYVDPKVVKVLDGRALKAGEFSFQLIDESGNVVSTAQNDEAGMVDFDKANNVSGDDMNPCCLQFTAPGTYTYTVREDPTQAKDSSIDYSTEVVKFVTTIEADDNGALKEKESYYMKYPTAADAEAGTNGEKYASDNHPSITNKVKSLSLSLVKSDSLTGVGLEGAVYALYRVDDSVETGAVQVMTATSNSKGRMVFTGVDASAIKLGEKYYFQEVSAPAGYTVSENKSSVFTIQQASDGKYYLAYEDDAATVADTGAKAADSDTHAGTVDDPIAYKEGTGVSDAELAITFNKLASDGSAVKDAKLAIHDEAGKELDSWTTDGVGHVVKGLTPGKNYTLTETAAPNGYRVASELVFTVDEYGKVSIVKGADNNDELNAYAEGSTLNLIDYKQDEKVEKKEVVKEIGITDDDDSSSSTKSSGNSDTAKTGDDFVFAPFVAALAFAAAVMAFARWKHREQ
ncbi:MAG: SpaA isopeptide-forming pilin-related protein [Coriobacteriia bacterium]|nr:SpaA isopeptide-forming pilin-related protein [Coriobacteriia bacterium]